MSGGEGRFTKLGVVLSSVIGVGSLFLAYLGVASQANWWPLATAATSRSPSSVSTPMSPITASLTRTPSQTTVKPKRSSSPPPPASNDTGRLSYSIGDTFILREDLPFSATYRNDTAQAIRRPSLVLEFYSTSCLDVTDVAINKPPNVTVQMSKGGLHGYDCVVTATIAVGDNATATDLAAGSKTDLTLTLQFLGPDDLTKVSVAIGVYDTSTGAWYTTIRTSQLRLSS